MIDLNKINSQFNTIKEMDAAEVSKIVAEHQNTVIKVGLAVLTLVLVGVMFNDHRSKEQDLHYRLSQLQQKVGVIKSRDAAVKALNDFKAVIPKKLSEFELITQISDYTKSSHVFITSLSPAESRDMGLYDLVNIDFNAESDNFKDMMSFLNKIETSNYPLRINTWTGREDENGRVVIDIQISAVLIHT